MLLLSARTAAFGFGLLFGWLVAGLIFVLLAFVLSYVVAGAG